MDADASTVREAREQYFAASGFSDATYRDDWVEIKLGPLPVVFPNTGSRKKALPLHDLHHIATGYPTTIVGESEISAFEIGGGCGTYVAAWVLDAGGMALGLVRCPRKVFRAFVRGRHSHNLYREGWCDSLLEMSVGELKQRCRTDGDAPVASWRDKLAFVAWSGALCCPVPLGVLVAGYLATR